MSIEQRKDNQLLHSEFQTIKFRPILKFNDKPFSQDAIKKLLKKDRDLFLM